MLVERVQIRQTWELLYLRESKYLVGSLSMQQRPPVVIILELCVVLLQLMDSFFIHIRLIPIEQSFALNYDVVRREELKRDLKE